MEEFLLQNASTYASKHQLKLLERLGFGIHGIVFVAVNAAKGGNTAIKVHRLSEPFHRECAAYERLRDAGISEILGFSLPQIIGFDDQLLVIEMSIVTRPFILDFAGAWLDQRPNFPPEIWQEWETQKRSQFERRWPKVQAVLEELELLDIYMVDVSPSNIAFLD